MGTAGMTDGLHKAPTSAFTGDAVTAVHAWHVMYSLEAYHGTVD